MAQRYAQITPADDWYYVCEVTETNKKPIVWKVAVWALSGTGEQVFGLVAISGTKDTDPGSLVSVPPLKGCYKHKSELTQAEQQALVEQKG